MAKTSRPAGAYGSGRPASFSLPDVRAGAVLDAVARYPGTLASIESIARLPQLSLWSRAALEDAIDVIVSDGRLEQDAFGRLVVLRVGGRG